MLDVFVSIVLIIGGVLGLFRAIFGKLDRGQSRIVAFVGSILFIVGGILCLVLGFPIAQYGADDW